MRDAYDPNDFWAGAVLAWMVSSLLWLVIYLVTLAVLTGVGLI